MTTAVRNPTQVPVAHPIAQRWSPRAFDPMFDLSAEDITALGEAESSLRNTWEPFTARFAQLCRAALPRVTALGE